MSPSIGTRAITNTHLRTGETGNLSRFRLSDNYLRFYLKYI